MDWMGREEVEDLVQPGRPLPAPRGGGLLRRRPPQPSRLAIDAAQMSTVGRQLKGRPPDPSARTRRVVARLTDGAKRTIQRGPLAPGRYQLDVWIGQAERGALAAAARFPDLPASERGHELTVVVTAHGILPRPEVRSLHLPRTGSTEELHFPLRIPARARRIEARIAVLHENRIVQTLLLRAEVGRGRRSALRLVEPEATFRRDLDGLAGRRRFDAALLFNDQAGAKLMTAFRDRRASTVDLARVDDVLADLATILEDATNRVEQYGPPSNRLTGELLAELARTGHQLRRRILQSPTVRDELASARRIQVVAATPEGVLPLEMCYDAAPPDDGARICPGWKQALASKTGTCAQSCPADKRAVVCPVAFWGTSKVIERYVYDKARAGLLGGHEFGMVEEAGTVRKRLAVLDGGLCAAAKQARDVEPRAVDQAFRAVKKTARTSREVTDWPAWRKAVGAAGKATMLVLLAHTDVKSTTSTLVIGDRKAALLTEIDDRVVGKAGSGNGALVMLLGCSTAVELSPLQSFIAQFWEAGAKIVIGTLCKVLGRHAAPIAEELVAMIAAASKSSTPSALGDLMPRLRRRLLARGFPIVLAVTAFGDADWQI